MDFQISKLFQNYFKTISKQQKWLISYAIFLLWLKVVTHSNKLVISSSEQIFVLFEFSRIVRASQS